MRSKVIIILIVLLTFGLQSFAQQSNNFKELDKRMLEFYYMQQWDSLINEGKIATKLGYDYFYLNYRMAVAHFYKEQYLLANHYFQKALKFNPAVIKDLYFKELYYRSLTYTLQNNAALSLLEPDDSLKTLFPNRANLSFTYLHGGVDKLIPEKQLRAGNNQNTSFTSYQQSINLFDLGTTVAVTPFFGFRLNLAYANLDLISAIENLEVFNIRNFSVNQVALNFNPAFYLSKKHELRAAVGYSQIKGNPFVFVDSTLSEMGFKDFSQTSYMGGLDYSIRMKKIKWGLQAVYSNFGLDEQWIAGTSLDFYPRGNLDFYSFTRLNAFSPRVAQWQMVLQQKIGFKVNDRLWFEGDLIFGDVQNFSMISDNFTFELPYHTKFKLGLQFIYMLNKRISILAAAQFWSNYTEQNLTSINLIEQVTILKYSQTNLTTSVIWKF